MRISDWSSDVCSSDLKLQLIPTARIDQRHDRRIQIPVPLAQDFTTAHDVYWIHMHRVPGRNDVSFKPISMIAPTGHRKSCLSHPFRTRTSRNNRIYAIYPSSYTSEERSTWKTV